MLARNGEGVAPALGGNNALKIVSPGKSDKQSFRPTFRSLQVKLVATPCTTGVGGVGYYEVRHNGRLLCRQTRKPLLDGCRKLLALGYDPSAMVELWHRNGNEFALRARISAAAKLTVDEHNGTVFAKWKPFSRSAVSPRIARFKPTAKIAPRCADGVLQGLAS